MGFFKRLFGICETQAPADGGCWTCTTSKIEITLDRTPELSEPGGAIRLEGPDRLEGPGIPQRVLVVHGEDGRFHAFPNRCTHSGRRLDPLAGEEKIRCCSVCRSMFDYEGRNLSGAATEPLQLLCVETEPGRLIIRLE